MSETSGSEKSGRIRQMGVLDLTSARSADELSGITGIEEVGVVLIPEHLATALARIPMEQVGSVVPVPQDGKVQVMVGQTRLTGAALAAGDPETTWIVAGQLIITTPVEKVGYKEMRISGQLTAPRGSETALGAKIAHLTGQVLYYPPGARFLTGSETIGREFLELLPQPTPLMIVGLATFASDVTVELLQSKVPEIGLAGMIKAPKGLVPLLQVLAVEKLGEIKADE